MKFKKFILNSTKTLSGKWDKYYSKKKYKSKDGYSAEAFWTYRLSKNGFGLKGAGRSDLSEAENLKMYREAKEVFINLCLDEKVVLSDCKVMDVGCGSGYYTDAMKDQGVTQYHGIDITDCLMDRLNLTYPNYKFRKLDISTQMVNSTFDLIIMIDVAQHITQKEKFSFAMQNIKSSLSKNGLFIVTADLTEDKKNSYYESSKSMRDFQKEFEGYDISEPKVFRDKYIFTIKK